MFFFDVILKKTDERENSIIYMIVDINMLFEPEVIPLGVFSSANSGFVKMLPKIPCLKFVATNPSWLHA